MATGIETRIVEALCDKLTELAASPAVAWPNVNFEPEAGSGYLRPWVLPGESMVITVGSSGYNRYSGVFQVSVFWPANLGITAPTEVASAIAALFKRGTTISREGVVVRVHSPPTVERGIPEPGWLQIPVSIRYQAEQQNPS